MGLYWNERARIESSELPPAVHPWCLALERAVLENRPELYRDLKTTGQLESYLRVRVLEALDEQQAAIEEEGLSPDAAAELALDNLLPKEDAPVTEDWEIEGGVADAADALEAYLEGLEHA